MVKTKRILSFVLAFMLVMPAMVVHGELLPAFDTNEYVPVSNLEANKALGIQAKGAILMEAKTGEIIYELDPDEALPIASVTKIMTILLIYEALEVEKIHVEDVVTISESASGMGGSQIFLETGEKQSVHDLLKSIIIASANDSSVAMAEVVSGSEEAFVALMNQRAKELGMENTNFINCTGLDEAGQFSTARDVAIMTRSLITRFPEVFDFSGTWQDTITHVTRRGSEEFGLTNTNKLIHWYDGATGLKTGSTSQALYCLSATAHKNNMDLIAVVLGVDNPSNRFREAMVMLDYGYANYKTVYGKEAGVDVGEIYVEKGMASYEPVVLKEQVVALLPKTNQEKLSVDIHLEKSIEAPAFAGDLVGEAIYYHEEKEVGKTDLILGKDIEKAGFSKQLERVINLWFN